MYTTLDGGLRDGAMAGLEEGVGPTTMWILRTLFSGNASGKVGVTVWQPLHSVDNKEEGDLTDEKGDAK